MEPDYRQEIKAFILASETLLSPVLLQEPLTPEERKVIEYYAASLVDRCKEHSSQ